MKRLFLFIAFVFALGFGWRLFSVGSNITIEIEAEPVHEQEPLLKIVSVDLEKDDLRMFSKNSDGEPYGTFRALQTELKNTDQQLLFATNGGIFQEDLTPLGLYIENGTEQHPVNLHKDLYGNFYLQPNGIFYLTGNAGGVVATEDFESIEGVRYATQSGPLLLVEGKINSNFDFQSTNRTTRSGVCFPERAKAVFILANQSITFYEFAQAFLDQECTTALYLDGAISTLYSADDPSLPFPFEYSVIIGVVKEKG